MFLFAKHDRVVEIKNDPAIGALKQAELKLIEADGLEQNDDVMPSSLPQNVQPFSQARAPRRYHRGLDSESSVIIETIPQAQPRARCVTMLYDAEDFHRISFLQLTSALFQRLRSRGSRASAIASYDSDLLVCPWRRQTRSK